MGLKTKTFTFMRADVEKLCFRAFLVGGTNTAYEVANRHHEAHALSERTGPLGDLAVPGVTKVNDFPDDALRLHATDPLSAIVALTHDPRIDDMGMMEALKTEAFYIGAMGSTRTSASRRERLKALDLSDSEIDKLHAPIGLPIGSKTPPEIAIAILAEITAVRQHRAAAAHAHLTSNTALA